MHNLYLNINDFTREYERNLLTEVRARPVIGPVVSSDRMTSKKGAKNTQGSTSSISKNLKQKIWKILEDIYDPPETLFKTSFNWENPRYNGSESSSWKM